MTLYVIDDHPLMREAVVMLLRRLRPGANVVELDRLGGIEAAVKQHGAPDLICLDLKLPDTTGASGVHELKKRFPETPLAVLSASPAADAEEQCIEAGADIYIEKSSGAQEIGNALRALLSRRRPVRGARAHRQQAVQAPEAADRDARPRPVQPRDRRRTRASASTRSRCTCGACSAAWASRAAPRPSTTPARTAC